MILDRKSTFLILLFTLPLLFFPKINLINIPGRETAGIRIDDIILIGATFLLGWAYTTTARPFSSIEKLVTAIIGLGIFSYTFNKLFVGLGWLHVEASLPYSLRLIEYFMFFYIGALTARQWSASTLLLSLLLLQSTITLLQKGGLIGAFMLGSYKSTGFDRFPGIASFPSEAGALIAMLFAYLLYDDLEKKQWIRALKPIWKAFILHIAPYALFLICALLSILSGSRVALAAIIFIFLCKIASTIRWKRPGAIIVAGFFFLAGAAAIIPLIQDSPLLERSQQLFSYDNIALIKKVWQSVPTTYEPVGYESIALDNHDVSWWIRIHKWCYALKVYLNHPECYLQGVGPGFAMTALDGGFIRILVEYGLIGVALFGMLFWKIANQNTQMKWMVVAFLINMIFFDAYLAYKAMALLFFASGSAYWQKSSVGAIA